MLVLRRDPEVPKVAHDGWDSISFVLNNLAQG